MNTRNRGFTLIEILVVITIIGMLASIILASLRTTRVKAADARVRVGISQINTAILSYYIDNQTYPPIPTLPPGENPSGAYDTGASQLLQILQDTRYLSGIPDLPPNASDIIYRKQCGPDTPCGVNQNTYTVTQNDIMENWLRPACGSSPEPKAGLFFILPAGTSPQYKSLLGVYNVLCYY